MVEMTIRVPNELANRLKPVEAHLPEILEAGLQEFSAQDGFVYQDVIDFLASSRTATQIAEFKPSDAIQARVSALLDKNRAGKLSEAEAAELDEYRRINHMMSLIKAKARHQLEA